MLGFNVIPANINLGFIGKKKLFFAASILLVASAVGLFTIKGLSYGIDFQGGIMIDVRTQGPADLGAMRSRLGDLGLGEVTLQEFGQPDDVLIRVQRQEGGKDAQQVALAKVKQALGTGIEYRRTEFVGPKVSSELVEAGAVAIISAVVLMLLYIWFRFEWQFSIGAVVALIHDVALTIGMFAVTGIEFNLASIAAILTIVGYSINDTVVVYDRVRENLRRFKTMPMAELADLSINETLSRTVMTSVTTLLALIALYVFGGEVISGFVFAMIFGVVVGTYSSIFIAVALLLDIQPGRQGDDEDEADAYPEAEILPPE